MFNVVNSIPIGNNLAITIDGVCDLKSGTSLEDENGNKFTLLSTGMARYINANDIKKYTEILLTPNRKIGRTLFLN